MPTERRISMYKFLQCFAVLISKMASRRITKFDYTALKSSRVAKLSLYQSGSLISPSRARTISTFANSINSLSRSQIFNGMAENDVVSEKLLANAIARKFLSSTPLQYPATSASQVRVNPTQFTEMAWEGIVGAVDAARVSKQQVVEFEHLMKGLLEQKDGLA